MTGKIPFDKLDTVDHIPMDSRPHCKVEYGILRKSLIESKTAGAGN